MSEDVIPEGLQSLNHRVDASVAGERLDKALAILCPDVSRARLQALIKSGHVCVSGIVQTKASAKLEEGDAISVDIPAPVSAEPEAEDIPLDIVYEDADLLVINKQAGLVVHPGAGNWSGTLVNALLHHCAGGLSGIGGVMRPGIVHRLDKETSGLMVVAKNDFAHQGLSAQLADRTLSRIYHALCLGVPMPPSGTVDKPIGRHGQNRLKMAVSNKNARDAVTYYKTLENYGDVLSLIECKLETGRTHQIRVHMAAIGYPLVGDPLYGPQKTALQAALKKCHLEKGAAQIISEFPRQVLHARSISFIHPRSDKRHSFESDYPEDIGKILKILA